MTILVFVPYYLPGFKSGGPARSIANLVSHLASDHRFVVATSDRDAGDAEPYPHITPGAAHRLGDAEVIYLNAAQQSPAAVARLVRATRPDVLYLNSFFSRPFSINVMALRRLGLIEAIPTVLAPRGEFSPGALGLKGGRKRLFIGAARALRLHRGTTWQASTALEAADIRRCMGNVEGDGRSRIVEAGIIPGPALASTTMPARPRTKESQLLRVAFLSRLAPKKNLLGALRVVADVRGALEFDIFGPIEDEAYWRQCQAAIQQLPRNICATYRGPVPAEDVGAVLARYDLFLLPTLGENYGHVIREALAAGTPVLVSDQTPWRGLRAAGVGWDMPLADPAAFRDVIENCIAMDDAAFAPWSARAAQYARAHADGSDAVAANRRLFQIVAAEADPPTMQKREAISAR